jgi:hypothetical protein
MSRKKSRGNAVTEVDRKLKVATRLRVAFRELELGLIQTQMAQKPMPRAEV